MCSMTRGAQARALRPPRGVGGGIKSKGTYGYLWLIHVDVWQKPTQYWTSIILQLKINKPKKKRLDVARKASGSHEPRKNLAPGLFWSGSPSVFFRVYFEVKNWSWWICWIIVLQCCPLGLFTHTALSSFDTLANTVQLRVKIMARLKHLSLEAIHNIPLKTDSADRAHLVLCCWFCHLGIEPARVLLRSLRKQSRMQAVGWFQ